jgi:hypothetical protein
MYEETTWSPINRYYPDRSCKNKNYLLWPSLTWSADLQTFTQALQRRAAKREESTDEKKHDPFGGVHNMLLHCLLSGFFLSSAQAFNLQLLILNVGPSVMYCSTKDSYRGNVIIFERWKKSFSSHPYIARHIWFIDRNRQTNHSREALVTIADD